VSGDNDLLAFGEHGPEGCGEGRLSREDLLRATARYAAAGVAAGPLLAATTKAWAAGEAASAGGDPVATMAVEAAKQYSGITLNTIRETGPQAADDKLFGGPLWKKLTGINLATTEAAASELFTKQVTEHIAKSGAVDIVEAFGGWVPDFADRGVIIPIDDHIKKYKAQASLKDIHPAFRSMATYKGKTWGFFDDGDTWMLYYRKDIFDNAKLKKAHSAKFGKPLRIPRTWDEMTETSQFITDQMAPKVYGQGMARALGNPGNYYYFYQTYRSLGGEFFDRNTMDAKINGPLGVKAMNIIMKELKSGPPGGEKFDFLTMWTTWLQGKTAMLYTWPPTGRISENYAQRDKAFSFLPKSKVVGKVGYAVVPGKHGWINGILRCVSADSKNLEAAYLFTQWNTSPSISLQRVMLPYSLRDPYRLSHFRSPQYRKLWSNADEYLRGLREAANNGIIELIMVAAADYSTSIDRAMTAMYAGKDVKATLDATAQEWNGITKRVGVDKARESYANYLKLPGSTAKNTAAARGQAVHA
jgi:multiple sugar transport system substrate-binding protein